MNHDLETRVIYRPLPPPERLQMFTLQSSPLPHLLTLLVHYQSPLAEVLAYIRPWYTSCCACAAVTVTPHVVRNVVPNVTDLLQR